MIADGFHSAGQNLHGIATPDRGRRFEARRREVCAELADLAVESGDYPADRATLQSLMSSGRPWKVRFDFVNARQPTRDRTAGRVRQCPRADRRD